LHDANDYTDHSANHGPRVDQGEYFSIDGDKFRVQVNVQEDEDSRELDIVCIFCLK
jgi:hypothetical protein